MRRCPVCGRSHDDGIVACPDDGHPLPTPRTILGQGSPPAIETMVGSHAADEAAGEFVSAIMEPGTLIGAYRLVSLLGKGGMGEVYLALHTTLGRKVALKLLRTQYAVDRDAVRRFFTEARSASQINHPNIVAITDFIENESGNCFYVMEYLEGETLAERIGKGALPLQEILTIAEQIALGLKALHGAGVVHRDLKPANIFLVQQPDGPMRVKLLDFGLAKLSEETHVRGEPAPKNPETLVGTPEYMSPEQIRGVEAVDHRIDIYSLGVVLYEMVALRRPIVASSMGGLLVNIVTEPPRPLEPDSAPPPLERLIMQCLEKQPDDRPPSAEELVQVVRSLAPREAARRRPAWIWAAVLAALVVAGVALFALISRDRRSSAPPPARTERPIAALKNQWQEVKHRSREGVHWAAARPRMDLFHLDGLKTGAGARAEVTFRVGGSLQVDERSVVLIEAPDPTASQPGPVARIKSGRVHGTAAVGRPLLFYTPDGKLGKLTATGGKPAAFRLVARDDGTVGVAVLKGTAKIEAAGRTVELQAGRVVDLAQGRLGAPLALLPYPGLLAPGVDEQIDARPVSLRWEAVPNAARYRLQVSTTMAFDHRTEDRMVEGTSLLLAAPSPGTRAWRVASVDQAGREGEFGFARRFSVRAALSAPSSVEATPPDNAVVKVNGSAGIPFRWAGGRPPFLVLVARSPTLKRFVVARSRVTTRSTEVTLAPGIYYWRLFEIKGAKRDPVIPARRLVVRKKQHPELHLPEIDWKPK